MSPKYYKEYVIKDKRKIVLIIVVLFIIFITMFSFGKHMEKKSGVREFVTTTIHESTYIRKEAVQLRKSFIQVLVIVLLFMVVKKESIILLSLVKMVLLVLTLGLREQKVELGK